MIDPDDGVLEQVGDLQNQITALDARIDAIPPIPTELDVAEQLALINAELALKVPIADLAATDGAESVGTPDGSVQLVLDQSNPLIADYSGATSVSAALQAAINESYDDANRTIELREGKYQLTSAITINQGVAIVGPGSVGSTLSYGLTFDLNHSDDGFHWDGNGQAFHGTGGGMRNALIVRRTGFNGGAAIKITAFDDDHRPGEMWFEDVLAYGTGTGTFVYGLDVDGSNCDNAGGRGVRTIRLNGCRFASATGAGWRINQVTNFYAVNCAIDTGTGSNADIVISGKNQHIFITGFNGSGGLTIAEHAAGDLTPDNFVTTFHFSGRLGGGFTNNDETVNGFVECTLGTIDENTGEYVNGWVIVNKSKFLKIRSDASPDFMTQLTVTAANVTGDSATYTFTWDSIVYDHGSNLTVPANTINIVCAGKYTFVFSPTLGGLDATHTACEIKLTRFNAADVPQEVHPFPFNPGAVRNAANFYRVPPISVDMMCDYGDYIRATIKVTGGVGDTVDIYGEATANHYSTLSGKYISS